MALLTGRSITFTIQYAFQINKSTGKKKPDKPKLVGPKADSRFFYLTKE